MYTIIAEGTATKERTLSEDRQFLQVQTAMQRMAQDFAQAYSPLYHSYVASSRPNRERRGQGQSAHRPYRTTTFPRTTYQGLQVPVVVNEENGAISFLTTSNRRKIQNSKESQYAWISYSLENNPDDDKRADAVIIRRVLSTDPYTEDVIREDTFTEQRLLDNVSSLRFEFWDSQRKRFVERTRNMSSEIHLLRAVRANIVWVNEQGQEESFERIFRPFFPFFDTEKDRNEKEKIIEGLRKKKASSSKTSPSTGGASETPSTASPTPEGGTTPEEGSTL